MTSNRIPLDVPPHGEASAVCRNRSTPIWEQNDPDTFRGEVLGRLNAAKGGGYASQSDHSTSSSVPGPTSGYLVHHVRQYGRFSIRLEEFDEPL